MAVMTTPPDLAPMHLVFHVREPMSKQMELAQAVQKGANACGDIVTVVNGFKEIVPDCDGAIVYGIGGLGLEHALLPFNAYKEAGKRVIFIDKGYTRDSVYRIAVDDFQPLSYFMRVERTTARYRQMRLKVAAYKRTGSAILLDGASEKFCAWKGLGNWHEWGRDMIDRIRAHSDRAIIYRPRPSRHVPPQFEGVDTSQGDLAEDMLRAGIVVSYGGNIGFDAVVAGKPHFAIGDSIARPISETDWKALDKPYIPEAKQRQQWLASVAHCQYTAREFATGDAWRYIRATMALIDSKV